LSEIGSDIKNHATPDFDQCVASKSYLDCWNLRQLKLYEVTIWSKHGKSLIKVAIYGSAAHAKVDNFMRNFQNTKNSFKNKKSFNDFIRDGQK